MKRFWKKQVPALFLALVMVMSLMPAALAAENNDTSTTPPAHTEHDWGAWTEEGGKHKRVCGVTGCKEAETHDPSFEDNWKQNGSSGHIRTCTVCTVTQTSNHTFSTTWEDKDASSHKTACSLCRYEKTESHNFDSYTDNGYGKHQRVCSTCGRTDEAAHNYTYTDVGNGTHKGVCDGCEAEVFSVHTPGADGKCTAKGCAFQQVANNCTVTFYNGSTVVETQTVAKDTAPNAPKDLSKTGHTFMGWSATRPTASVYGGENCLTGNQVSNRSVSQNTNYYAVFQAKVSGKGITVNAGSTNGKVVGPDVQSKINDAFKTVTGRNFSLVTFSDATPSVGGVLYSSSSQGSQGSLGSVPYTSAEVSKLYFVPGVAGIPYSIVYTATDAWNNTVSGTLTITATANTKIAYSAAPGKTTEFKDSDFFSIFRSRTGSSDFRYVSFTFNNNDFNNFDATIYAGSTPLTREHLKTSTFYYSDPREGDYSLDSLKFKPENGAKSSKLVLEFIAYGDDDDSASGTVELTINGTAAGEVVYEVAPGGKVELDAKDFNNVYQSLSDGASRNIRWVAFDADSNYTKFHGSLTCGDEIFSAKDLSYNGVLFYYGSSNADEGDYDLNKVKFEATSAVKDKSTLTIPFRAYYSEADYQSGNLIIKVTGDGGDFSYNVAPGKSVKFDASRFNRFFRDTYSGYTMSYVVFDRPAASAFSHGTLYYDYGGSDQTSFTRTSLDDERFYYNPSSKDYGLDDLTFVADKDFKDNVELKFTCYGAGSRSVSGTLVIRSSTAENGGDVPYKVAPGKTVAMKRADFNNFFRKSYASTLSYIVFSRPDSGVFSHGTLYSGYGTKDQTSFTYSSLGGKYFYYNSADAGRSDYYLDDLLFAADIGFKDAIELSFTAYDEDDNYVEGKLTITPDGTGITTSNFGGNVRYSTVPGTNVQINPNDIARYYKRAVPGQTMQYITLLGVPTTGTLYYNYYGTSTYGTTARTQITVANCASMSLYASPSSAGQYSLTELTYVPSGVNYCATIPFTAVGTGGALTGSILISVNNSAVPEVYGVTMRNGSISLPATSIYNAVLNATGTALSGIQLLSLPAANTGSVYVGATNTLRADTATMYSYSGTGYQMNQLRFVASPNFTGSVEIPYVALNSTGGAIASGTFSIGVVNSVKSFRDMPNNTWCYKYVTELSDSNIISGYSDGSFKPNSTLTYGAALKLIMLAAGYPEQAPTGKNVFSGYLDKAKAEGIVTRSNVDLSAPITRLQVAQIAAGAMKLNTSNLSSVKPFTDTADVYVQALNAAGIVEGYFNNGTSSFRPSNTLTRGQVSAIVRRMQNYRR